jgi:hypothetical protein
MPRRPFAYQDVHPVRRPLLYHHHESQEEFGMGAKARQLVAVPAVIFVSSRFFVRSDNTREKSQEKVN